METIMNTSTETTVNAASSAERRADPMLITGGMGVYISWWRLSRIVSMMGGLGVVSGTGLEFVHPRILQQGDPDGNIRRALAELARRQPALAPHVQKLIDTYYIEGGKASRAPYRTVPILSLRQIPDLDSGKDTFWEPDIDHQVLLIASSFAEVWLAKEGHSGKIGINFLRKVEKQLPWSLYGAILAGVDYVVVGAGNPGELPGMIRSLSRHEHTSLGLKVFGADSKTGSYSVRVRPELLVGTGRTELSQPKFLAIVSSFSLAKSLAANTETRPYGFVVEGHEAGGHSAPPSKMQFDAQGNQLLVYTGQDNADIPSIAGLGLPFWLAGSYAKPEFLKQAITHGASGVQFGTLAACSGQSGLVPELRSRVIKKISSGMLAVKNSLVSPTGFPFKVAQIEGTLSESSVYESRKRRCDLALLQVSYITPEGKLGSRCPAEPVDMFVAKGGREKNTEGRVCLCNALLAAAGYAQIRPDGYEEPSVVTLGEDLSAVKDLLSPGTDSFTIGKALQYIKKGYSAPLTN
jgi:NAD(P)H-dependent flavin oxidoreductase YrpB (nitropropane dioxygenase family)